MNRTPVPGPLRWLLNGCMATLVATGLADLLGKLVQRYTPTWLESIARADSHWPAAWKYDYVHWLYSAYVYEALGIGIIGGLAIYWWAYDEVRANLAT